MKILKVIGSIVTGLLIVILLAIYLLPDTAHMQRSVYIDASPHQVYLNLVSYRNFNSWSPWAVKDPDASYTYEGPEFGVGAKISWESSNPDLGNGSMEIVETLEDRQITSVLNFDGYKSAPYGTFLLSGEGNGSRVVWSYDEHQVTGLSKIFMLGIDGFLGRDWELALERLKKWVEAAPDLSEEVHFKEINGFKFLGKEDTVLNDPDLLSVRMAKHYEALMKFFSKNLLEPAGHPIAIITGMENATKSFICGIPIMSVFDSGLDYQVYDSHEGLAIFANHHGPYGELMLVHQEIREFINYYGYEISGNPWEEYVTNQEPESDSVFQHTIVYYPIR